MISERIQVTTRCNSLTTMDIIKVGIPVLMVFVLVISTPNPHRQITDFPSVELTPASITTMRKRGRRSDHFELWIRHEDGRGFFHRDPEPRPIEVLKSRIPDGIELRLVYDPTPDGNVLMQIAASRPGNEVFLAFDSVMSEYRRRRLVVYVVAAIWFVAGTLLFVFKLRST